MTPRSARVRLYIATAVAWAWENASYALARFCDTSRLRRETPKFARRETNASRREFGLTLLQRWLLLATSLRLQCWLVSLINTSIMQRPYFANIPCFT